MSLETHGNMDMTDLVCLLVSRRLTVPSHHVLCRYADRLPGAQVILLTNDLGSRQKAGDMGLKAMHLTTYARTRKDAPELMDLVARTEFAQDGDADELGGHRC